MLAKEAGKSYDNYGTISHQLLGKDGSPEEAEQKHRERMEQQMEAITRTLRRLTEGQEHMDEDQQSTAGMHVGT